MKNLGDLLAVFTGIIGALIPLVVSLSILSFVIGIGKFIGKSGDQKAVTEGKNLMIWGVIALFLMISIYGILRFFTHEFGFPQLGLPLLPK